MRKLEISVWAVYTAYDNSFHYTLAESDMSTEGWVLVKTHEVPYEELPREVLVPGVIKNLKEKKKEIRADAEEKVMKVEEEIQQLLSLEHKV